MRPWLLRLGVVLLFVSLAAWASDTILRYRKIDIHHSTIGFVVPIAGGMSEVYGKFTDFAVAVDWVEGDVTGSSLSAVIQAASIDTGIPERDEHLRSADFFDVEHHPTITFASSTIEKRDDGYVARGTLTVRGTPRAIELPFRLTGRQVREDGKTMLGWAADLTIDRQQYGIAWKHPSPDFVGDQVSVILRILTKLGSPETR